MRSDVRVLLTSLSGLSGLRELALAVRDGALVGLGTREEVYGARKLCADLDHVMFVEGTREEIPWAEAWFDVVLDGQPDSPTPEMLRVLKPGGRVEKWPRGAAERERQLKLPAETADNEGK